MGSSKRFKKGVGKMLRNFIIGTYSNFAKQIVDKVGTHGARKLINALQKEISERESRFNK